MDLQRLILKMGTDPELNQQFGDAIKLDPELQELQKISLEIANDAEGIKMQEFIYKAAIYFSKQESSRVISGIIFRMLNHFTNNLYTIHTFTSNLWILVYDGKLSPKDDLGLKIGMELEIVE